MKNNDIKTVLESVIFDLENIKKRTREDYTYKALNVVIDDLNKLKKDREDDSDLNFIKRITYQRMKQCQEDKPEKSKQLYDLYQKLKKGELDAEEGFKELLQHN
jgi:hypothetical protein